MWYAAYMRITQLRNVHVPNVRDWRPVTVGSRGKPSAEGIPLVLEAQREKERRRGGMWGGVREEGDGRYVPFLDGLLE